MVFAPLLLWERASSLAQGLAAAASVTRVNVQTPATRPLGRFLAGLEARTSIAATFWLVALTGLLVAGALIVGLGALTDSVTEGETQGLDVQVTRFLATHRDPVLNSIALAFTHLGDFASVVVITLAGLAYNLWRRFYRSAGALAASVIGGFGLNVLLKNVFHRPRPLVDYRLVQEIGFSFPSGHAMVAAALYTTLAFVLLRHIRDRGARRAIVVVTIILAIGIATSRVYLGVHYLTDVLAGALAGGLWALTLMLLLELPGRYRRAVSPAGDGSDERLDAVNAA